jgi:exo-beta-1,3-glucanase (GH17 family)
MRLPVFLLPTSLFLGVSAAIIAVWAWMGAPVRLPGGGAERGEQLYCVSYAPFRSHQSPFDLSTRIGPEQVEEDLQRIRKISNCVRTYATDFGSQHVPALARKLDMKVLMGIWIGDDIMRNRVQVETALSLANRYPDVISAVIVGNEVLLRRDRTGAEMVAIIKEVKSRTTLPVTYADVWEFWLKNPEIAPLVDFITIHTLPYWEDIPIEAAKAAAHIDATRKHVTEVFPGKEVLIGEVGWPSAGRMREGALPSLSSQARVLDEVTKLARQGGYKFNWIEVIDQPWKRRSEGTVGGYWGLFESGAEQPKFLPGEAVSDHPYWKTQAATGLGMALAIFGLAGGLAYRRPAPLRASKWLLVAVVALSSGALIGMVIEKLILETLNPLDWVFSIARTGVVIGAAFAGAAALVSDTPMPVLSRVLGNATQRTKESATVLDFLFVALCFFALQSAFALIFDPRYRDFPAATLTMGLVPFLALGLSSRDIPATRGEKLLACGILPAMLWLSYAEGIANWQALWFVASLGGLTLLVAGVRANRKVQNQ